MKKMSLAILLIILACFTGCERIMEAYGRIAPEITAPPAPVFAVNTMAATQGPISNYFTISGDIVSASAVDTFSDAAGRISRVFVSVGSRVERGDPIVEVDPSRPGMEFVASVVRAPVSGTIIGMPAQLGMTISQAVPLARIAGGTGLEVRLFVPERFISRVSLRQTCEITLDAWPGDVFRGRVSEISPVVDPASRTMEVRVAVDNIGSRLKAGMFASVRIITEQRNNIVRIPSAAMIQRFGEEYVFVAEADPENPGGYIARRRTIVPGIRIDGMMEVRQGLRPGEDVVIRGQSLLTEGSKVNIIERVNPLGSI